MEGASLSARVVAIMRAGGSTERQDGRCQCQVLVEEKTKTAIANINMATSGETRLQTMARTRRRPTTAGGQLLFAATLACCLLWPQVAASETSSKASPTEAPSGDNPEQLRGISRGPDLLSDIQAGQPEVQPEPRQYFKIHITPGRARGLHKQQVGAIRRRAANGGPKLAGDRQPQDKPKISNATLKKLLNQSMLLKSQNSTTATSTTTLNGPKKSNFKFVFIQRAAASPSSTAQSAGGSSGGDKTTKKTTSNPEQQPSLVASVSKQLASSLLSSAAQIVGNLSSSALSSPPSAPSITDLLSAASSSQQQQQKSKKPAMDEEASGNSLTSSQEEDDKDRELAKRLVASAAELERRKKDRASLATSINTKTRQPSKVYNLPVKFGANGQPYGPVAVFSTIRRHFATIKKLQNDSGRLHSAGDFRPLGSSSSASSSTSVGLSNGSQNKQPNKKQTLHKLKGANSRFIYLPLKYLSNARPTRVLASKAHQHQHKSTSGGPLISSLASAAAS